MSTSPSLPIRAGATAWPVVALLGLDLDSLGNYLASLGLLRIARRKWPAVRGCWRNEEFVLVNGPATEEELIAHVSAIASEGAWSEYAKVWDAVQKADTKAQNARGTSVWRAAVANESELPIFHAHLGTGTKLSFNPLFGTGGNSGKRDFTKGWQRATSDLQKPPRRVTREMLDADLSAFLNGEPCSYLSDFNAACWFSKANKIFNSGTSKPFREGQITPWAMALACEAFPLFAGSSSRRLSAGGRAFSAFPFVVAAPAPVGAGEAGRVTGEVWLPVWHRPMTFTEVESLFSRGRAEVNGRGAVTPAAFAAAIVHRGVDAGLSEFRRFSLLRTTSENTFESRLLRVVPVRAHESRPRSRAVDAVLKLRDALPPDGKQFMGLRGPIDRALTEYVASESERDAFTLVDAMADSLRAVDRNRNHRARKIRFTPLPAEWLGELCASGLTPEARVALAVASLTGAKANEWDGQLLPYLLGVDRAGRDWNIPEATPFRRVWANASLATNLANVVDRRLIEAAKGKKKEPPFRAFVAVELSDITAWLEGAFDERQLERWLWRFSLFEVNGSLAHAVRSDGSKRQLEPLTGPVAVFALLKPLFSPEAFAKVKLPGSEAAGARLPRLTQVAALLSRGDLAGAVEFARQTWHGLGIRVSDATAQFKGSVEPAVCERLLAAMLVPAAPRDVAALFQRWCAPPKTEDKAQ